MLRIAREATYSVSYKDSGKRIDQFLVEKDFSLSRARIQTLIKDGFVKVNNKEVKCSYKVKLSDNIHLIIPSEKPLELRPEPIDFEIIYEDPYIIVIDKPAGLVIHPAPGHYQGTLVHGLLYKCNDLSGIGGVLRPGIVHRLDKDTSGIMLVAKDDLSHRHLINQFKEGIIDKEYWALVHGPVKEKEGIINMPITRHPVKRKQMYVSESGKKAITLWRKIADLSNDIALISANPRTGRTHQIRVHMSYIGYPILGDHIYGRKRGRFASRQMLHSKRIAFQHPGTGKKLEFSSHLPEDMKRFMIALIRLKQKD
ncbi:MAG: RluA family pseudouridine synthase [Deltaproteobacteria bacterium]|nr:MAG: RluA family pseudouridine synthase [Deltaproteobacteria bacterium]